MKYKVSVITENKSTSSYFFTVKNYNINKIMEIIKKNVVPLLKSINIKRIDKELYQCKECSWTGLDSDKIRIKLNIHISAIHCPECNGGIFKIINKK